MFPINIIIDLTWKIAFFENVASSWRVETGVIIKLFITLNIFFPQKLLQATVASWFLQSSDNVYF